MARREVTTALPEQTAEIGRKLGVRLKGGEVIECISDLGGGKTTFIRGVVKGFGSDYPVASPTFTISYVYPRPDGMEFHHFDFYRLQEAGIVAAELAEVIGDPQRVVAVEWGDIVHGVLPPNRLEVKIRANGETERQLQFTYPATLAYLVEGL